MSSLNFVHCVYVWEWLLVFIEEKPFGRANGSWAAIEKVKGYGGKVNRGIRAVCCTGSRPPFTHETPDQPLQKIYTETLDH